MTELLEASFDSLEITVANFKDEENKRLVEESEVIRGLVEESEVIRGLVGEEIEDFESDIIAC